MDLVVDCVVMTRVDILLSVSLEYTIQRDIPEPCHGGSNRLSLQSGTICVLSCQANVNHVSCYM